MMPNFQPPAGPKEPVYLPSAGGEPETAGDEDEEREELTENRVV